MTLVPIDIPPGLNSDDTPFAARGRWADGNNVRFFNGRPQVIGGWSNATTSVTLPFGPGVTYKSAFAWTDSVNVTRIVFGSFTNLRAWVSGTLHNISPASTGSAPAWWSFGTWGDDLLGAPYMGKLCLWGRNTAVAASNVATAPASINRMIVTPQRQVLALGCNEEVSGTFNPRCIRGSDVEDHADWTTSSTNNAFEDILPGPGNIVTGSMVGQYVAVWTNTGLWLGEFVGDPAQTYAWTHVAENCGIIGPQAFTVVDSTAYWLSPDYRFFRWTPGALPEPIPCPILHDFQANAVILNSAPGEQPSTSFAVHIPKCSEIWFFYPDLRDSDAGGNVFVGRYLAFSLLDGAWFRGQLNRSCMINAPELLPVHGSSILGIAGTPHVSSTFGVFIHEKGSSANGAAMSWHIQTADFALEESRRRAMVKRFLPDFEDQIGDVSLTLYVRDRPQSPATTKGPYTLATTDTKEDLRVTGKIMAVKFSGGAASGSYMRLGKPLFDVMPLGER